MHCTEKNCRPIAGNKPSSIFDESPFSHSRKEWLPNGHPINILDVKSIILTMWCCSALNLFSYLWPVGCCLTKNGLTAGCLSEGGKGAGLC